MRNSMNKNVWRNLLIALTALVPCLICLLFINSSAVNVLFLDEWEMVPFCAKIDADNITFAEDIPVATFTAKVATGNAAVATCNISVATASLPDNIYRIIH